MKLIASLEIKSKFVPATLARQVQVAKAELPALTGFDKTRIENMSDEEATIRWLILIQEIDSRD